MIPFGISASSYKGKLGYGRYSAAKAYLIFDKSCIFRGIKNPKFIDRQFEHTRRKLL